MPSPEVFHQGRLRGDRFFVRERTRKTRLHTGPLSLTVEHHLVFDHPSHTARLGLGSHFSKDINVPGVETIVDAAKTIISFAKNHTPRP